MPVDPTKINVTFSKWTTDQAGVSSGFDFNSAISGSTTLYAQYRCNSGYLYVDGQCVKSYIVTLDPNYDGAVTGAIEVVHGGTYSALTTPGART